MSDWVENWKEKPYALADLAKDAEAVLDVLNIREAHLVGLSMGGMVAQEFAFKNAQRTQTLTSIMSSGNTADEALPKIAKGLAFDFMKIGIKYGLFKSDRNLIKLILSSKMILRGDAQYDIDVKETAEQVLYNLKQRNGYNPKVQGQHEQASNLSGSRYEKLKDFKMPALMIHGMKDPLVPIEHSKKLAAVIPHAKTKWFENMGHDLPPDLMDAISKEILLHISMKTE